MRPAENPLDLNNLPDQNLFHDHQDSSSGGGGGGGGRKKKGGGKDDGKVYECRFCSLKFCKSQALGGHMNRHRQERETETLNRARQLVFNNDTQVAPHLSCQPITAGGGGGCYHVPGSAGDPYRPLYPARAFPAGGTTSGVLPAVAPPPPARLGNYPPPSDYYVGHVLGAGYGGDSYTCVGAPVGYGGGPTGEDGWGRPQQAQPNRFQDNGF